MGVSIDEICFHFLMPAPRNFKRCPWHARLTNIFTRLYGIIQSFVELLDVFIANAVDEGHTVKF